MTRRRRDLPRSLFENSVFASYTFTFPLPFQTIPLRAPCNLTILPEFSFSYYTPSKRSFRLGHNAHLLPIYMTVHPSQRTWLFNLTLVTHYVLLSALGQNKEVFVAALPDSTRDITAAPSAHLSQIHPSTARGVSWANLGIFSWTSLCMLTSPSGLFPATNLFLLSLAYHQPHPVHRPGQRSH